MLLTPWPCPVKLSKIRLQSNPNVGLKKMLVAIRIFHFLKFSQVFKIRVQSNPNVGLKKMFAAIRIFFYFLENEFVIDNFPLASESHSRP